MTTNPPSLPDFAARGLREILGDPAWERISLRAAECKQTPGEKETGFSQLGRVIAEMEAEFGRNCALGLAQRAGSASFKYFQTEFAAQLNLTWLEVRTMPVRSRLRAGLTSIAACFRKELGVEATFEDQNGAWRWVVKGCPECRDRKSESPVCFFTVGLVQEFLGWSAGSKFYPVEEAACCARGDGECEFRIGMEPLE